MCGGPMPEVVEMAAEFSDWITGGESLLLPGHERGDFWAAPCHVIVPAREPLPDGSGPGGMDLYGIPVTQLPAWRKGDRLDRSEYRLGSGGWGGWGDMWVDYWTDLIGDSGEDESDEA